MEQEAKEAKWPRGKKAGYRQRKTATKGVAEDETQSRQTVREHPLPSCPRSAAAEN